MSGMDDNEKKKTIIVGVCAGLILLALAAFLAKQVM
ncbi:MAG: hypothetical protein RL095_1553 [Verrucomicrobiota bacterium]|jgi:glutamine amidotransferase PdxT